MDRRTLLRTAGAVGLGTMCATWPLMAATISHDRVRPGSAGWPGEADWTALARSLRGKLVRPADPWAACEGTDGPGCASSYKELRNPYFLGDQSGGTQVYGYHRAWRNAPSAYGVEASDAADVAAAVAFARRHRLRLVVKGGGHSYFGGSNAPDSLLIWTRRMNAVEVHDAFVPAGDPGRPVKAVSIGAGAVWMDAYDAVTTKAGRYVQGGGCATVGVAGFLQGGGFGSFSKRYGLGAASLLEAEVVTADGRVAVVNRHREPDLFWALKGGGGGTFAVITRVTLATHDLPEFFGGVGGKVQARSDEAFRELVGRFVSFYATALFDDHWGEQVKVGKDNTLELSMVFQGLSAAEAQSAWKPFVDWVSSRAPDLVWKEEFGAGARPARMWWDAVGRAKAGSKAFVFDGRPGAPPFHAWWDGDQDQVGAYLHGYDSVWLPRRLLEPGSQAALADALVRASRHIEVGLHFNKGLAGARPEILAAARESAMNPDVADSFVLAIVATGGPPPLPALGKMFDAAVADRNAAAVVASAAELRRVAPDTGSYVSESDFFNARWERDFWGANHTRLARVKARYDPDGLFYVHHGVGSDKWREGGFEWRG